MNHVEVKLLSGNNTLNLAEKIADFYGEPLANVEMQYFSDGEFKAEINK